ncbi:hypothetical protein [Arthrobacter sp. B0490]|uniref:hypothetical protein n=1 Tax=Arthrobacter sp. B0490 TaxID=2058891 RepID=UPI000CE53F1F|nr:hypothetical protein [Arthrobacter sp. B0490]
MALVVAPRPVLRGVRTAGSTVRGDAVLAAEAEQLLRGPGAAAVRRRGVGTAGRPPDDRRRARALPDARRTW